MYGCFCSIGKPQRDDDENRKPTNLSYREEIVLLAKKIEEAGASIINTGIGWHEARIPTIATSVPRAGFSWVTKKLKGEVGRGHGESLEGYVYILAQ